MRALPPPPPQIQIKAKLRVEQLARPAHHPLLDSLTSLLAMRILTIFCLIVVLHLGLPIIRSLRPIPRGGRMIVIPPGPRLGRTVLTVNSLSKAYGERTLFSGLSFTVDAGAVVGVVRVARQRMGVLTLPFFFAQGHE